MLHSGRGSRGERYPTPTEGFLLSNEYFCFWKSPIVALQLSLLLLAVMRPQSSIRLSVCPCPPSPHPLPSILSVLRVPRRLHSSFILCILIPVSLPPRCLGLNYPVWLPSSSISRHWELWTQMPPPISLGLLHGSRDPRSLAHSCCSFSPLASLPFPFPHTCPGDLTSHSF